MQMHADLFPEILVLWSTLYVELQIYPYCVIVNSLPQCTDAPDHLTSNGVNSKMCSVVERYQHCSLHQCTFLNVNLLLLLPQFLPSPCVYLCRSSVRAVKRWEMRLQRRNISLQQVNSHYVPCIGNRVYRVIYILK